jgi:D-tyrosyl-tRNA(Tyr) deacylase
VRALIQRVREARVTVAGRTTGEIGAGLLVLAAVATDDTDADRDWLARKIVSLRIFDDDAGVMNRSVADVAGGILAVSQFTLYASTKKGRAPRGPGPRRRKRPARNSLPSSQRSPARRERPSPPASSAR